MELKWKYDEERAAPGDHVEQGRWRKGGEGRSKGDDVMGRMELNLEKRRIFLRISPLPPPLSFAPDRLNMCSKDRIMYLAHQVFLINTGGARLKVGPRE